ncbi:MAG TPA: nuclear transport factor 2 family protein [Jatrophihabitantaceae bacterium]|jgi:ketosteroid isomerase-like protein
MTDTANEIRSLGERWVDAELRGDADALDALAVADFALVGPLGFVLTRQQWLGRFGNGDFEMHSLTWDEVEVRDYCPAAIAIGRQTQQASYRGAPSDGQFRVTHIAIRVDGRWLLAGMHLSPIGAFRPPANAGD